MRLPCALYNFDPPPHQGWPQPPGGANVTAPVLADLDGDGKQEVMWGTLRSLVVKGENGTNFPGWPNDLPGNPRGPATVADLDGDGSMEVGIISELENWQSPQNIIMIWHADGTQVSGWPKYFTARNNFWGADLCPVFADINGDGLKEVVWCSSTSENSTVVHVDRHDGVSLPSWPVTLPPAADRTFVPPAVGDVDGDGLLDIVLLTYSGQVHLLHHDGQSFAGWPVTLPGSYPGSGPALADIDHDGELEIFAQTYGGWTSCYEISGQQMPGWPQRSTDRPRSPAFGDLNGDGRLEIVPGARYDGVVVYASDGQLLPGWPPRYCGGWFLPSLIVDLDNDGKLDVISADGDGYVRAWNSGGLELYHLGFPIKASADTCYDGPVVGDVDGDGYLEIAVYSTDNEHLGVVDLWDLGTRFDPDKTPHPTVLGDNAHQSRHRATPRLFSVSPAFALTNEAAELTATGDFFLKGMRVFVDAHRYPVISETVTSITFTVSAGLGQGWHDLTVSNVNSSATTMRHALVVVGTLNGDEDGDGLPNGWEIAHGLDPFDGGQVEPGNGPAGDPDLDAASNWAEYRAGTNPRDRESVFRILSAAVAGPGAVALQWSSAAGKSYTLYRSADPGGPFGILTNTIPGTPPVNTFVDSTASGSGSCYYRVGVE